MTTPSNDKSKEEVLGKGKTIPTNTGEVEMYLKEHCFVEMETYASIKSREDAIGFYKYAVTRAFKLEEKETLSPNEIYDLYQQSKHNTP